MRHHATVKMGPRFKSSSTCPYKGDNCTPRGRKKLLYIVRRYALLQAGSPAFNLSIFIHSF